MGLKKSAGARQFVPSRRPRNYTITTVYSRIEVRALTRLLLGSRDGAKVVFEELRILIPILIRRRGLLQKHKLKEARSYYSYR